MAKICKILVANRGEIAVRILKTCREMGIKTVAVYSQIDKLAPFVRRADEAYCIGEPPALESYLNQEKILQVARACSADAIHPGYGFLSENALFAEMVEQAGITFIGPPSNVIRLMGDKTSARRLAQSIGIPLIPGVVDPIVSEAEAEEIAANIGYPVLIKATAGGGGKGMRVVHAPSELRSAIAQSRSESKSAFGDESVYIEKYLQHPRHVEVQILADIKGNVIHLGERDCSVQRRHQKVIEESPSPILNDSQRANITSAAVKLASAGGYVNAGTVEFLYDGSGAFYFMEVNTRLQVEHPVTEMRCGMDLVREQIRIAEGSTLSVSQEDVTLSGHAIECRIYAEDPSNGFFPSTGKVRWLRGPSGIGIREDRGIEEGDEISHFYDPLLSKLITWGPSREIALNRMAESLGVYELVGVDNNIRLCHWIVNHPMFKRGECDTNFLGEHYKPLEEQGGDDELGAVIAGVITLIRNGIAHRPPPVVPLSKWRNNLISYHR